MSPARHVAWISALLGRLLAGLPASGLTLCGPVFTAPPKQSSSPVPAPCTAGVPRATSRPASFPAGEVLFLSWCARWHTLPSQLPRPAVPSFGRCSAEPSLLRSRPHHPLDLPALTGASSLCCFTSRVLGTKVLGGYGGSWCGPRRKRRQTGEAELTVLTIPGPHEGAAGWAGVRGKLRLDPCWSHRGKGWTG